MTEEEAKIVINLMLTADDFCPICAKNLLEGFTKYFPQFTELAEGEFRRSFGKKEFEKYFTKEVK